MNFENTLSTGFKWRDRLGIFHDISEMETSYVFFVLRMIWNHSVPKHMRICPYKYYSNLFGHSFYTKEYVRDATIAMIVELSRRDDLTRYFRHGIDHMRKWSTEAYCMETISTDQKPEPATQNENRIHCNSNRGHVARTGRRLY